MKLAVPNESDQTRGTSASHLARRKGAGRRFLGHRRTPRLQFGETP